MKTIFASLSPNVERDDVRKAWALLFQPWRWKRGFKVQELENEFSKFHSTPYAVATASGRTALYTLLKALRLNYQDEVLLQAYTCVAVPDPILWADLKPVYVDIDTATLNMSTEDFEKKITKESKVLIIQHTFGIPANIDKLLEIAKRHNLFVIEDCAHALGATYKGKRVGTFGDAAFFSFGRDKVISSVFGGMVIVHDEAITTRITNRIDSFRFPTLFWIKRLLLHVIMTSWVRKTYDKGGFGKALFAFIKMTRLLPKAVYQCEREGKAPEFIYTKFPNACAVLALHQFKKLDRFNNHRRRLAEMYRTKLPQCETQKIISDTHPVFLRYAILHNDVMKIFKQARREKILLGDWYRTPIAPYRVHYDVIGYVEGSCPNAERVAERTVNLPTDIHISEDDAERIVTTIRNYCA